MSWYLLHREICDNVLWTPIRLRCRDGNGSTIALVFYHDLVHRYGVHLHLRRWIWTLQCDWRLGHLVSIAYLLHLVFLHHIVIWWFYRNIAHWSCWKLCGVEQNFLLFIVFRDAGTLFWLNEMLLGNEHEVWGSFVNQKNVVQSGCNHLLRSWVQRTLVIHVWMRTESIWELLEVDQALVASWICDSTQFGIVQSPFLERSWFLNLELRFLTRHWLGGALVSLSSELNRTEFHNQQHSTNTFGVLPLAGVSCLLTWLLCVASEQKTEAGVCT